MADFVSSIGGRIRNLRREKGLTLKNLADHVNVTASLISQLERGIVNPSVSLLKQISDYLGVTIASLLESDERETRNYPLLHSGERKTLVTEGNTKFQLLSQFYNLNCEFVLNEWQPGASTGKNQYTHEGFECGFVLKGKLKIELGEQVYILKSGDSMTFPSTVPHLVCNPTKKVTIAVWVNSVPWIFKNR